MLVALLLAAGEGDSRAPHFSAACRAEQSAASCTCMVDGLSAAPAGRLFLEVAELTALPEAEHAAAYAALIDRQRLSPEAMSAILARAKTLGDGLFASCR